VGGWGGGVVAVSAGAGPGAWLSVAARVWVGSCAGILVAVLDGGMVATGDWVCPQDKVEKSITTTHKVNFAG
jgi:hypothetical protein